jgi:hypothetical protein
MGYKEYHNYHSGGTSRFQKESDRSKIKTHRI